ncbi:MAG: hypothetical protein GWP63_08890 [Haliea sp.]|nr:hypothetical protein [Haliea sp.]
MDQTHKNRMVLLSIIGIPVTMILAATWLWYYVVQGDLDLVGSLGTANRGDLVQPPRQIDEAELKEQTGFPFSLSDLEQACEHSLYVTRQIHVAMGKEFKRLRRLYISDVEVAETSLGVSTLSDNRPAPASFSRLLENEHRGMKQVTASTAELEQLFPELGEDRTTWYLVDPAGWIMMSYNTEVPYKDVIGDLKFLLKNSSE